MNTLVIGNGFDLAHKLPTQYKDFMYFFQFCEAILKLKNRNIKLHIVIKNNRKIWKELKRTLKEYICQVYKDNGNIIYIVPPFIVKYYDDGNRNCWYKYFKAILNHNDRLEKMFISINGDNWVDFEKEIARVIKKIESAKNAEEMPYVENPRKPLDLNNYIKHNGVVKGTELYYFITRSDGERYLHMNDFH